MFQLATVARRPEAPHGDLESYQPDPRWGLCVYLTPKLGLLTIRHRGIKIVSFYQLTILQDTGAPTAHDKPGSLTCPV